MTGIIMKQRFVLPLPRLAVIVLRYVYDKKHMESEDIKSMERSIVHWSNKVDITEDETYKLQSIGKVLKDFQDGKLDERKELFKEHGINWAKFHRMPHLRELGNEIS